jgi:hypothetical protein
MFLNIIIYNLNPQFSLTPHPLINLAIFSCPSFEYPIVHLCRLTCPLFFKLNNSSLFLTAISLNISLLATKLALNLSLKSRNKGIEVRNKALNVDKRRL